MVIIDTRIYSNVMFRDSEKDLVQLLGPFIDDIPPPRTAAPSLLLPLTSRHIEV